MLDYRGPDNRYIFKDMIEIVESKGEGFYEYMWTHPKKPGNDHSKISFVKLVKPLGIWIGAGEYQKDFRDELQQKVLDQISRIRISLWQITQESIW